MNDKDRPHRHSREPRAVEWRTADPTQDERNFLRRLRKEQRGRTLAVPSSVSEVTVSHPSNLSRSNPSALSGSVLERSAEIISNSAAW